MIEAIWLIPPQSQVIRCLSFIHLSFRACICPQDYWISCGWFFTSLQGTFQFNWRFYAHFSTLTPWAHLKLFEDAVTRLVVFCRVCRVLLDYESCSDLQMTSKARTHEIVRFCQILKWIVPTQLSGLIEGYVVLREPGSLKNKGACVTFF